MHLSRTHQQRDVENILTSREPTAVVITATVGKDTLRRAVESVLGQTFEAVYSVVVVDGPRFLPAAQETLGDLVNRDRVQLLVLPQNTGGGGYVCHRIYGALPLLVNQDFVFFLDDDNWYDSDHVANLVGLCVRENLQWGYGLRKIINEDGSVLCADDCESLGRWPTWYNERVHHVDTNCYCLRREAAVEIAARWHRSRIVDQKIQPSADTEICGYLLRRYDECGVVGRCTVNYVLGSWGLSPKPEFFLRGNEIMRKRYGGKLPWRNV